MSEIQQAEQESPSKLRSAASSTYKHPPANPKNSLFGTKSKFLPLTAELSLMKKKKENSQLASFSQTDGHETQRSSQVSERPIQNIKKLKAGSKHESYFPKQGLKKTTNF